VKRSLHINEICIFCFRNDEFGQEIGKIPTKIKFAHQMLVHTPYAKFHQDHLTGFGQ